ncbi:unnamed protein product, partial [Gulo gulo]
MKGMQFLQQPRSLIPRTSYPTYHMRQPKGKDQHPLWLSGLGL